GHVFRVTLADRDNLAQGFGVKAPALALGVDLFDLLGDVALLGFQMLNALDELAQLVCGGGIVVVALLPVLGRFLHGRRLAALAVGAAHDVCAIASRWWRQPVRHAVEAVLSVHVSPLASLALGMPARAGAGHRRVRL